MKQSEKDDLVALLVSAAFFTCSDPRKPGVVIQKLMHKYGDKIKQLKSEDFLRMRIK